jgi:hypothetical protein
MLDKRLVARIAKQQISASQTTSRESRACADESMLPTDVITNTKKNCPAMSQQPELFSIHQSMSTLSEKNISSN